MSPQPRTPAPPADTPATPADTPSTDAKMVKGEHNPFVNQYLAVAQELADEREDVLERIGANRELLRAAARQGYLSTEQADSIRAFYPDRPRKTKDAKSENGN